MKLPLIGDGGVGKSSFAKRLCKDKFPKSYEATKGSGFYSKKFEIKDKELKIILFDLAGQKRFFSLDTLYWKGASCGLAIFDLTRKNTFERLKGWIEKFREANPTAPILIVGNKKDLQDLRTVSKKEGKQLAQKFNAQYFEASAKTGAGVEEIFRKAVKMGIMQDLTVS